jgi:hypothetical protein
MQGVRIVHVLFSTTRGDYRNLIYGNRVVTLKDPAFIDAARNDPVFVGGAFVGEESGTIVLQYGFVISATDMP